MCFDKMLTLDSKSSIIYNRMDEVFVARNLNVREDIYYFGVKKDWVKEFG